MRVGTNGNLLFFGELVAIGVDRISAGIKYRISRFASFLRVLQRGVRTKRDFASAQDFLSW